MKSVRTTGLILMMIMVLCSQSLAQEEEEKKGQELLERIETLERQLKKVEEEAKARKGLEVTEEEKAQQEKEVLEAVGREYTLSFKGTFSFDYSLNYTYTPAETLYTAEQYLQLQRTANHTLTHTLYTSYSIFDNLSTNLSLPVVYRYNRMGTDDQIDETDIGDMSMGVAFQPPSRFQLPRDISTTFSLACSFPTGRSPYKINPDTELSTGSGYYAASLGASFSKRVDPVILFWSLGYSYPFPLRGLNYRVDDTYTLDKVETGSTMSFGMGMAYSLSYATSINASFSYGYQQSTALTYKEISKTIKTGDGVSASFGMGMGIVITPKTSASISVSFPLTGRGFAISTRIPFDFVI